MFGSIGPFKALGAFFAFFFHAFTGAEKLAKSFDNICGIAEAETQGIADQMEQERAVRLAQYRIDNPVPPVKAVPQPNQAA
jgi:hypothetical protein